MGLGVSCGRRSSRRGNIFFFFQAEDGIRDYKVTGVQTCALPIFQEEAAAGSQVVRAVGDFVYAQYAHVDSLSVRPGQRLVVQAPVHALLLHVLLYAQPSLLAAQAAVAPAAEGRDRKSTRLNSSHLVISYAVFCLKKKIKEPNDIIY